MRPMSEAPTDGIVTLHMPDGTSFDAYLVPVEGLHESTWAWGEVKEGDAPDDWCDGICWGTNSNGKQSTQPVGWSA